MLCSCAPALMLDVDSSSRLLISVTHRLLMFGKPFILFFEFFCLFFVSFDWGGLFHVVIIWMSGFDLDIAVPQEVKCRVSWTLNGELQTALISHAKVDHFRAASRCHLSQIKQSGVLLPCPVGAQSSSLCLWCSSYMPTRKRFRW